MKSCLILCTFVVAALFASPATAQRLHPSNEKVVSGDMPELFFTNVALWHLMNNRNKPAIDVLLAQFETLAAEFDAITNKEKITGEDVSAMTSSCCDSDYYPVNDAVAGLVFAVVESEGRYAVKKGAPKQSGKAQADTLRRAKKLRDALLAARSRHEDSLAYDHIVRSAIGTELRNRKYPEAIRLFRAEYGAVAELGTKPASEVTAGFAKLHESEREMFVLAIGTVLASGGEVGWAGKTTTKRAAQRANIKAAIALYKATKKKNIAIEASILESDPAKRNEYFEFVHKAAISGKLGTTLGWRHAALMYEELGKQANNAVGRTIRWSTTPEPVYDDQSCGD